MCCCQENISPNYESSEATCLKHRDTDRREAEVFPSREYHQTRKAIGSCASAHVARIRRDIGTN